VAARWKQYCVFWPVLRRTSSPCPHECTRTSRRALGWKASDRRGCTWLSSRWHRTLQPTPDTDSNNTRQSRYTNTTTSLSTVTRKRAKRLKVSTAIHGKGTYLRAATRHKLQRVLNAAARVVNDTRKFDRGLSTLLHDELHWLDVPERVTFKLGLMTYRCLHGQAPRYLADHVTPAIKVASWHRLRSANRHWLIVPRCRLNTYGRQALPVAGPTVWNSLPDELRDLARDVDSFKQFFKTILFSSY